MDEHLKRVTELRISKTIEALARNQMQGFYSTSQKDLFQLIDLLVKDDRSMTNGGSMTLHQTGVIDYLSQKYSGIYHNRELLSPEERQKLQINAFGMDTYFTSTNAITENGELYNVDGYGNRVAAMIYGPKQVIVVAGYNKIVPDLQAAITRVQKTAAPANTMRLNKNTPCAVSGECRDCAGNDRICAAFTVLRRQCVKDRIKVIILADPFGY